MNNETIGACIQHFFAQNGKISLFLEQQAVHLWSQTVGEYIAKQTTKVTAKQGILYVTIPNAALRFELMGNRSQIMAKLNEMIGAEAIKGIIIR